MKYIKFEKLTAKNFRSHNDLEVDFSINHLLAIVGPNGAGKSSMAMALRTGLYGDPGDDLTISDVVNETTGKNMEINIFFQIEENGDIVKYKIERYYLHSKKGNSLFLLKFNDKTNLYNINISSTTVPDTIKKIEDLILPKDVFCNTIYFAQQVKDFFTALNDSEQKKIFNAILGLDDYVDYYKKVSSFVNDYDENKNKIQNEILKLETLLVEKEKHLSDLKLDLEKRSDEKKLKIKCLQDEIENLKKILENKNLEFTNIKFDEKLLNQKEQEYNKLSSDLKVIDEKKEKEKIDIEKDFESNKTDLENKSKNKLLVIKNNIQESFNSKKLENSK